LCGRRVECDPSWVSLALLVLSCYTVGPHYCKALRGCGLCMYVGYSLGCTMSVACWLVAGWACYAIAWVAGWELERVAGAFGVVADLLKIARNCVVCAVLLWAITTACGWSCASEGCRCGTSGVQTRQQQCLGCQGMRSGAWRAVISGVGQHPCAPLLCAEFYLSYTHHCICVVHQASSRLPSFGRWNGCRVIVCMHVRWV
jgi:hypothetical protein